MNSKIVKFLLVEDDENHAHLITRTLSQDIVSHSVDRVSNGEKALKYLHQEEEFSDKELPDVIILDLNLPGFTGHEVIKRIKQDDALLHIPIVVLTTSDDDRDRQMAYALHVNSYLVKPIGFEEFNALIRDLGHYWGRCNKSSPVQTNR